MKQLSELLREARQYVSDAGDDNETNSHSQALLVEIDRALAGVVAQGQPDSVREALRLLGAEDERQSKLHELLETIREGQANSELAAELIAAIRQIPAARDMTAEERQKMERLTDEIDAEAMAVIARGEYTELPPLGDSRRSPAESERMPTARPVAFRVPRVVGDKLSKTSFRLFDDEDEARRAACDIGADYDGLYLVADRRAAFFAQPDPRRLSQPVTETKPAADD